MKARSRTLLRRVGALTLLVAPAVHAAGIYQCRDDQGHRVYSQLPCGDDAVTVEIEETSAGIGASRESIEAGQTQADAGLRLRDYQAQLRRLQSGAQRRIEALQRSRAACSETTPRPGGPANAAVLWAQQVDECQRRFDGQIREERAQLGRALEAAREGLEAAQRARQEQSDEPDESYPR